MSHGLAPWVGWHGRLFARTVPQLGFIKQLSSSPSICIFQENLVEPGIQDPPRVITQREAMTISSSLADWVSWDLWSWVSTHSGDAAKAPGSPNERPHATAEADQKPSQSQPEPPHPNITQPRSTQTQRTNQPKKLNSTDPSQQHPS